MKLIVKIPTNGGGRSEAAASGVAKAPADEGNRRLAQFGGRLKVDRGARPQRYTSGRKNILSVAAMTLAYGLVVLAGSPVFGQSHETPSMAPVNPAFLSHAKTVGTLGILNVTPDGHGLGYIPSPVDLSHLAGRSAFPARPLAALPALYDLRTQGRVTGVKNQGGCGSCWAFASMSSLESNLLTVEEWDFSENNLKNTHGFDWGPCEGGNADISTAYLARWQGPVRESDDPYSPDPPYTSPPGLPEQKHVQEVLIISPRTDATHNDDLKRAVMSYGGLYTSYYASSTYNMMPCPSGTCTTYYYDGSDISNHAVTIVGWDDDFPAGSFSPAAPGNGAFIIKNSWGPGWGVNGGFFYISYYDTKLGHDGSYVFDGVESTANYDRVYQYDPLGMTLSIGYGNSVGWFANIFDAAASEELTAVGFYTNDLNMTYSIYVYTDVTSGPDSGVLSGTSTGSVAMPGYHTITLSNPVPTTSGQKFSVVVRLATSGFGYPIPVEYPFDNYSSSAAALAGQSYISSDGADWMDITSWEPNSNVCLKAFTRAKDITPPPAPVSLAATPSSWTNVNSFSIDWINPEDSSGVSGAYYKIGSAPASDSDGTYVENKPFTVSATDQEGQKIYVWLRDGAGNTSYANAASTVLYFDATHPADGSLTATSASGQVSLNWSGFSDAGGSGLKSTDTYRIMRNTEAYPAGKCSSGTQVYLGNGESLTDSGLTNGSTYYYRACANDNAGNVSTGATAVATLPVQTTVNTLPAGREIVVDAVSYIAPHTFIWYPGTTHTVSVTSPQDGEPGVRYAFASWSDTGSLSHVITTPSSDTDYTANFVIQYRLVSAASPAGAGSVSPDCPDGCWYAAGSTAALSASPTGDYVFTEWTGDCEGTSPSTSVLMSGGKSCTANFAPCLDRPVRNKRTAASFSSAGDAYKDLTTEPGDTIELIATTLPDDSLDLDRPIEITIIGGYGCGYASPDGYSIIRGPLTINKNSLAVTLENLILR